MHKNQSSGLTGIKRLGSRLAAATAGLSLALAVILPAGVAHAAANTLSLSSSAGKATKDSIFTVSLILDAGDPIDVVQGYVTYDSAKVAYQPNEQAEYTAPWTQDSGDTTSGTGYYQASRYRLPPFTTGTSTVVKLTFKALATSGNAAFGITSDNSLALSNGKNLLSGVSGVNVALAPAAGPNDPALPGTTILGTGTTPTRHTDPATDGNNGSATDTSAVSAEDASKAEAKAADVTKQPANSTDASANNKKLPWALLAGIAAVIVLALGAAYMIRKSNHKTPAGGPPASPDVPVAGGVVSPTPGTYESTPQNTSNNPTDTPDNHQN